jgi:hypothetical protein
MASNASQALGAPEIAGTYVLPKGLAKKMTAGVAGGRLGGAVGTFAATVAVNRLSGAPPDMPSFGQLGYIAVTESEIALVRAKAGAFTPSVKSEVLARVPRGELASVELDERMLMSHLKLEFANGAVWQVDIPKQHKKKAQALVSALDGGSSPKSPAKKEARA